jgi:uncharacterized protein YjbI with pentapeptide repeats
VTEPLSKAPRSLEDYRAEFMRHPNEDQEVELPEAETVAADAAFEKRFADMDKEFAAAEAEMTKTEEEANKVFKDQKAQLIAQGVDPRLFEEPANPQTLAEAKAEYMAAMAELKRTDPEHAARMGEIDFAEFEQMEAEMAQMEAEMAAANPPPPTRESVQVSIAGDKGGASRNLSNQDLSALDLSGMDFSGVDLSGAGLSKANLTKTNFAGANLTGADLSGADLTEADFTGATLNEADFIKAMFVNTKLIGMAMAGATFSKLDLAGADFSGCHGKGADFSKANLAGARFIGAKLPQSDFSGATLERTDFNSAELPAAQFDGAKAKGVQMEKADISGLHGGDRADFTGGNFRGAKGAGSIWEQSMLDGDVIGVLQGSGKTVFTVPGNFEIMAPRGTISLTAAKAVHLKSADVKITAKKLELVAQSIFERFTDATRWVKQAFQIRAGRVNAVVRSDYRVKAERIIERAEGDVKIDGRKIHLG